jgi:hypothetical protein
LHREYPIAAVAHDTPREPRGPWVVPGRYTVRLTVGGRAYTQPLVVRMDPRVPVGAAALARQFALASRLVDAMRRDSTALAARTTGGGSKDAVADSLGRLGDRLAQLYGVIEGADAAPTTQAAAAVGELERTLRRFYNSKAP